MASKYKQKWHYEGNMFVDDTPICQHREKKPVDGTSEIYHCKINPKVVHCCGKAIGCENYAPEAVQLSLFD